MSNYFYKCFNCRSEFEAAEIESSFTYLCSKCGKAEKNKPLVGVLEILYDYNAIKKNLNRETLLKLPNGKFWLYPQLWPFEYSPNKKSLKNIPDQFLDKLSLNSDKYLRVDFEGNSLHLMDETRNPTLSYKDRASIVTALKGLQLGVREISAASTGNAGSSIAGICARLGINSHIFVPSSIPEAKRIQIQSFGAKLYLVEGSYDDAFDLSLEISSSKKWYSRNTGYNPLTIEGKKWGAYDIFISSHGKVPDIIFVPAGDGVIISGIYKGFKELLALGWIEKLPRLIAVQAEGSDALVRFIDKGIFEFKPAHTIADSISAGAPRNLYLAAEAVKVSGGQAVKVSDEEILSAQKMMASQFGLLAEPSSAASLAGYLKVLNSEAAFVKEKTLLLITGNGLKDVNVLKRWNETPISYSYNEWLSLLK